VTDTVGTTDVITTTELTVMTGVIDPIPLIPLDDLPSISSTRFALDGIGMIPGLGEPFNLLSGGLGLYEGDYVGAGFSFSSAIPLLGNFTGAGGLARQGGRLITAGSDVPNAGGVIRSFTTTQDQTFYRVFSENPTGGFLTAVPPRSSAFAREALALPPSNSAEFIQEVLVPSGTLLQRSRALPVREWGRRGGAEQFQLLDRIAPGNFGPGRPLP
jgi:hypothetical protein